VNLNVNLNVNVNVKWHHQFIVTEYK